MAYGTLSPEFYHQNKKYFDDRLVQVLEKLEKKNKALNEKIEVYEAKRLMDQQKITDLRFRLKDTTLKLGSLKLKKKTADERLDEIEESVTKLYDDLDDALKENVDLHKRIKELEEELKKYRTARRVKTDSTNSNLPPSQDEFRKRGSLRPKSDKPVGGQPGHKVHRKSQTKADRVICARVKKAPTGAEYKTDQSGESYYAVQEISCDLRTTVTEFRYYIDEENGTELPEAVMNKYKISSVTYASSVKALALYMNYKGAIALERLTVMLKEISNGSIDIKPSTIVNWTKEFSKLSEEERQKIAEILLQSEVLHVDETGWKINGIQEWLHAISNGEQTLYFMTDSRSGEDGPLGFLQNYDGIVSHDHFKSYYSRLPEKISHAECNAHIDRALKRGVDEYDSIACAALTNLLHSALHRKKGLQKSGCAQMAEEELEEIRRQYREIIVTEIDRYSAENPDISCDGEADYIKVFRRMLEYEQEHLRFITDFRVEYTNTIAERCMRVAKARKKISGQSKNMDRGKDFANIQSIIQTANWTGQNTLELMRGIIESS